MGTPGARLLDQGRAAKPRREPEMKMQWCTALLSLTASVVGMTVQTGRAHYPIQTNSSSTRFTCYDRWPVLEWRPQSLEIVPIGTVPKGAIFEKIVVRTLTLD
jgi:hypothetical protein